METPRKLDHDEQNARNEHWLRQIIKGMENSNSAAEAMAQLLWEYIHNERTKIQQDRDPQR